MKFESDLALSDQVHDGEKQKCLVRSPVSSDGRISVPAFIGPQIRKYLNVFLKQGQVAFG